MAALAGLQIDNCEVWTDQPEMPGCDGSCQAIVGALDGAGLVEQPAPRPQRVVQEVLRLGNEQSWIEAAPPTSLSTTLEYRLDYGPGNTISPETLEIELSPESFRRELAASRTFLLEAEAKAMMAEGIGLRTTCQDLLVLGENGPVDNELRFEDECVRHKLLDLVGDLALAGVDLLGKFTAYRSGHRLNGELVAILAAENPPCGKLKRCA
jgi:UDP-3-O-[3-hydroxymyristoyl] N-acetylglucosamine deacetylase